MSPRSAGLAALALGLLAAVSPLAKPGPRAEFPVAEFARLPVLEGGRVKPVDSFARSSLLLIHGRQTLLVDGRPLSATEWLLDAAWRPETADTYKSFVIDEPDLLGLLGIERGKTRRFAYWQVETKRAELREQAARAEKIESARRSRFQSAVIALDRHLEHYERVKNTFMVSGTQDPVAELALFSSAVPRALKAVHGMGKASSEDKRALKVLSGLLERAQFIAGAAAFKPLAPSAGEDADAWRSIGEAMTSPGGMTEPHPGLLAFAAMGRAYKRGDAKTFEQSLREYEGWLAGQRGAALRSARSETVFNRLQPFVSGMALHIAALLAVFIWWGWRRPGFYAVASGLFAAAVIVHTAGLAARVVLQGRPPVTNLYSSAVFVGWVGALMGLFAERLHRQGFAIVSGAVLGFCTLLVAQHLTTSGDTMEMMRAVLDSNFWLATHVVTITIGYGATFLAGALAIVWVARRHFVGKPSEEASRALTSLVYGTVAFALLFSFVGTVLGGIWADQSWGRFWGWDPKENGALLIVLWNAVILHARWAGFARDRGIMILAVFGNVVTAFSWFGVNMLGIGLHSYGFMDQAFIWLTAFSASQLLVMLLGWLPPRFWVAVDSR